MEIIYYRGYFDTKYLKIVINYRLFKSTFQQKNCATQETHALSTTGSYKM